MKLAMVDIFVDGQVKAANDQVSAFRAARQRTAADPRLAQLWELRRAGWSLGDALEEVDRRSQSARQE